MNPEVQILVNPVALEIPEVRQELFQWTRMEGHFRELAARMSVGGAAVIVGTTDEMELQSVAVVILPGNFTEGELPWVVYFHNRGPRELTHATVKEMVAFIRQSGYTTYKALNQSGHSDKRWLRIFKMAGKPSLIGSCYLFDLTEDISDGRGNSNRSRGLQRVPRVAKQAKGSTARSANKLKHKHPVKHAHRHDAARVPATRTNRRRAAGKHNRAR